MGIKGTLLPDHMPTNKYELQIVGMPTIIFTKVSGIEMEIDVVDLPDRTKASGGNPKHFEMTVTQPMHHSVEVAAMELWFEEAQDPVSLTYKRAGTITHLSGSGNVEKTYTLLGMFCMKRKLPDLDFESEGDMAVIEWTISVDSMLPI